MKRNILALGLPLWLAVFAIWPESREVRAQPVENQRINYKLVPNLEPIQGKDPAPDFTLPALADETPSPKVPFWRRWWDGTAPPPPSARQTALRDFRGKLVLLNFWASWCEPCREEMPAMERLYQEFKDKGFVILAVDIKDRKKDGLEFVKEHRLSYPVVFDPEGKAGILYGAWGLPTTYLIDRAGVRIAKIWGPAEWHSPGARKLIQTLLDQKK